MNVVTQDEKNSPSMVKGRRTNETKESLPKVQVTGASHVPILNFAQYRQRSQMKLSLGLTATLEVILNAELDAAHGLVDELLGGLVQLTWQIVPRVRPRVFDTQ